MKQKYNKTRCKTGIGNTRLLGWHSWVVVEPIFWFVFVSVLHTSLPQTTHDGNFFYILFFGWVGEGVKVSANVGYLCTTACFHSYEPQLEPGGIQKRWLQVCTVVATIVFLSLELINRKKYLSLGRLTKKVILQRKYWEKTQYPSYVGSKISIDLLHGDVYLWKKQWI